MVYQVKKCVFIIKPQQKIFIKIVDLLIITLHDISSSLVLILNILINFSTTKQFIFYKVYDHNTN